MLLSNYQHILTLLQQKKSCWDEVRHASSWSTDEKRHALLLFTRLQEKDLLDALRPHAPMSEIWSPSVGFALLQEWSEGKCVLWEHALEDLKTTSDPQGEVFNYAFVEDLSRFLPEFKNAHQWLKDLLTHEVVAKHAQRVSSSIMNQLRVLWDHPETDVPLLRQAWEGLSSTLKPEEAVHLVRLLELGVYDVSDFRKRLLSDVLSIVQTKNDAWWQEVIQLEQHHQLKSSWNDWLVLLEKKDLEHAVQERLMSSPKTFPKKM